MAEKKVTKTENKTVKPITLRNERGDIYVLEFNRSVVKFAEAKGFKIQVLDDGISLSAIEELFYYSFRMHQPGISRAETDSILYDELGGLREDMLQRLVELYLQPFNTLIATEDSGKNSKMTVEL